MPNLNRVEVIGNVGKEPEMRFTPSGTSVTNFSLATNREYLKDGIAIKETDWFNVVAWGNLGENCKQFLVKGSLVYVAGRITLHEWEKPDGIKSSHLEIKARQVVFLSRNENKKEDKQEVEEEDIPF